MESFSVKTSVAVVAAAFVASSSSFAATVYDNMAASSDENRVFSPGNNVQFGDQIILAGSDRVVTDFTFPYFFDAADGATTIGNETITFSIYDNSGAGGAPGNLLMTSGPQSMSTSTEINTFVATGLSLEVPTTLTWTVSFGGIDAGETAGLLVFDPPTVGASFADFWQNNGGTWATFLIDNGAVSGNFAARVTAVPEPSTFALAMLSGLAWLGFRGYRRRAS